MWKLESTFLPPLDDAEVIALGEGRVVVRERALDLVFGRACCEVVSRRELMPAGVGRGRLVDRTVRGDAIGWLDDEEPVLAALHAWFEALRVELNASCWLGLSRFAVQVARYPGDGTGYARHRDALAGAANRRVTAIVYLNEGWRPEDGGQLRVVEGEGTRELPPELGTLVLFLSERVEHEVLPCFRPRFAVTAWYRGAEAIPTLDDPR